MTPVQCDGCGASIGERTESYTGIELHALIGVYEWEREVLRPLVFDVHLTTPDSFKLSRAELAAQMTVWLQPCRYRLLEALAEHLVRHMLREWPCRRVVMGIEKPGALGDLARVGVRIARSV
ncbi:MAG: dihydroneopterin aldolase [Gallionellaceae bacterium]|nr:MAG: dihydroneopterin aldolase [Gallionellaceae bacterium]